MLFSIVVPVYNVEKYLEECLDSIMSQVTEIEEGCEVILVDDGSTDSSGEICDRYCEKYQGIIKVFHKKNEGLLLTRRYGFKRSTGEYIVNCDSDDCLELGMLKKMQAIIKQYHSPDVIIFNHYLYDGREKEEVEKDIFTEKICATVEKEKILTEFMIGHSIVSMCGKVYKKSCIDKEKEYVEYADVSNGEDTLQSIEIYNHAEQFVYLNEALYDYRIGSGMTRKFDSEYYWGFRKVFEQINNQKEKWKLENFDSLFAIKILQTAGRAIKQSRYKKWNTAKEHKRYLMELRNDTMVKNSFDFMKNVSGNLQKDHLMLLKLLQYKRYTMIVWLLRIKNISDRERN